MVFEDDRSLAFLDYRPLLPGHCLLVPKTHYETLADLPVSLVGPLFQYTRLLSQAIEEGLGPMECFLLSITAPVKASRMSIPISWLVTARMASKASSGRGKRYPDDAALRQVQETLSTTIARLRSRL